MIRFARLDETNILKAIWHACFSDGNRYVDSYYTNRIGIRTLVSEQNGQIVSMLDMISVSFRLGADSFPAIYIYAAATLPDYQGRGEMHRLLQACGEQAAREGAAYLVLVPQTPSLVNFYRKQGFELPVYRNIRTFYPTQWAEQLPSACSEQFFQSRKTTYENSFDKVVEHSSHLIRLIGQQVWAGGGEILAFENNYAICWPQKKNIFIQEFSGNPDSAEGARAITACCAKFGVSYAELAVPGDDQLYGLAKPLRQLRADITGVYMNTMLD